MSGGANRGDQSTSELKVARTLNTVATIGAIHPTYHAVRDLYRHKSPESRARIAARVPNSVSSRAASVKTKVKAKTSRIRIPAGVSPKKVAIATTGAWLGLHSAELAGDVMARRSINGQLRQKEVKKMGSVVRSAGQSIVSKSDDVDRGTGIGMNLEKAWKGEPGDKRNTKYAAGAASGAAIGGIIGGPLGLLGGAVGGVGGYAIGRHHPDLEKRRRASIERRKAAIAAKKKSQHVEKRNFNAEADRQRRLGAYAGIGAGTGLVAGAAAARGLRMSGMNNASGQLLAVHGPKGKMTKKWLGTKAGLAALAATAAAGGAVSYKHGVSERNRTYM